MALDVLMVWHSFLLNPRWYRKSCAAGKKLLYNMDFPWAIVVSVFFANHLRVRFCGSLQEESR
jgi:hypothetical protein